MASTAATAPVLPRAADYNVGHAASQPVPEDIVVPEATAYEDPGFVTSGPSLNAREAAFFKARGYIVKRGLIDDPETFRRIVDHIWRHVPRGILRRNDPDSLGRCTGFAVDRGRCPAGGTSRGRLLEDAFKGGHRYRRLPGREDRESSRHACPRGSVHRKSREACRTRARHLLRIPGSVRRARPLSTPRGQCGGAPVGHGDRRYDAAGHGQASRCGRSPTGACTCTGTRSMAAPFRRTRGKAIVSRGMRYCATRRRWSSPARRATWCSGTRASCIRPASTARRTAASRGSA